MAAPNPVVYLDIAIADRPEGRIEITLRADVGECLSCFYVA